VHGLNYIKFDEYISQLSTRNSFVLDFGYVAYFETRTTQLSQM